MAVLVIDIGSSSLRTLLFDEQGHSISSSLAQRSYSLTTTPLGAATIDPAMLREFAELCIDSTLQHLEARQIDAVGMATFVGNVLGVDEHNVPITPVYTYADTRCSQQVDGLRQHHDVQAVLQRTGCPIHAAYHPARLMWLKETERELFDHVYEWMDIGTYLYRCWTGEMVCSYSIAAWSGLLNRQQLAWDVQWLDQLGVRVDQLPRLADYDQPIRGLTTTYQQRWSALRDVPFFLPIGDGAAANIGIGAIDSAHIGLTVGTTAALRLVTPPVDPVPDGLWCYRNHSTWQLIGGATSEGGNIFQWVASTFGLTPSDEVERHLAEAQPDSHGLTFLPLLAGERSPGWAAQARGSIIGLRLGTNALDILQAALEGVALRLSLILDQLAPLADPDSAIMAGGGALEASPAWTQILADALNRRLLIVDTSESTARGVSVLIWSALKHASLTEYSLPSVREIAPDAARAGSLRLARERQVELYKELITPKTE
ncbi:MAG: gluconokinase [Anaerolineae bacterium]|nr:gluconokinase [Anaerolineae bacterium]